METMNFIKWLREKHILHTWVFGNTYVTKNATFGFPGCEQRGMYILKKCSVCNKEEKMSLNLAMPLQFLEDKYDNMWRKNGSHNK
jgi:hypothetical protein